MVARSDGFGHRLNDVHHQGHRPEPFISTQDGHLFAVRCYNGFSEHRQFNQYRCALRQLAANNVEPTDSSID